MRSLQINFIASKNDIINLADCLGKDIIVSDRRPNHKYKKYDSIIRAIEHTNFLFIRPCNSSVINSIEFTIGTIHDKDISTSRFYVANLQMLDSEVYKFYGTASQCVKKLMPIRNGFYWVSRECNDLISLGYKIRV